MFRYEYTIFREHNILGLKNYQWWAVIYKIPQSVVGSIADVKMSIMCTSYT
jgi:hypothetical protein